MKYAPLLVMIVGAGLMAVAGDTPGKKSAKSVAELRQDLKADSPKVRWLAAEKLGKLKAEEAIGDLAKVLEDDQSSVRYEAALALMRMGAKGAPALGKALSSKKSETRRIVAAAFVYFGTAAQLAVPDLIAALKDSETLVRLDCAHALGEIGAAAKAALPALAEAAKDPDSLKSAERMKGPYSNACEAMLAAIKKIDAKALDELGPKILPGLIQALAKKDTRRDVLYALPQLGAKAAPAVPALKDLLLKGEKDDRRGVVQALMAAGWAGESVLVDLLQGTAAAPELRIDVMDGSFWRSEPDDRFIQAVGTQLKHNHPAVQREAARTLHWFGSKSKAALPALIDALSDQSLVDPVWSHGNPFVVGIVLGRIGAPAVPALMKALDHKEELARRQAARALAHMGSQAKKAIPALQQKLKSKDALLEVECACALLRAGAEPKQPLAAIDLGLTHPSSSVRAAAAEAVGRVGGKAKSLVPALAKLLDDQEVADEALVAIERLGPDAVAAVPQLVKKLKKGDSEVIARILGAIGPAAKEAVPGLIECLKSSANFKREYIEALGNIGPGAVDAVPAVTAEVKEDSNGGRYALDALGKIGPGAKAAVPKLVSMLKSTEVAETAKTLGQIGPDAKAAVKDLEPLLEEESKFTRVWAAFALARITKDSKPYLPVLLDFCKNRFEQDVYSLSDREAMMALWLMGPEARPGLSTMLELMADSKVDWYGRTFLAKALGNMGASAKPAVPHLIAMLKEFDTRPRVAAATALGSIGWEARTALGALTEALDDEDNRVVRAATAALKKIQGT